MREGLAAEALFAAACAEALGSRGVRLADDGSVADHSAADALTSSAPCERVRYDPGADPASLTGADLELSNFVERHDRGKDPRKAIAGPFSAEADASRVVYVSVDDVLTHRQTRSRDAAERRGDRRPGEWIFHSVAHVEADGESIVVEQLILLPDMSHIAISAPTARISQCDAHGGSLRVAPVPHECLAPPLTRA